MMRITVDSQPFQTMRNATLAVPGQAELRSPDGDQSQALRHVTLHY
jgi:hypothetical protein